LIWAAESARFGLPASRPARHEDQLVPPAAGRQLAALIPGAQFELLPAWGQVLTTDCEQEAAGAIGAFLDRVEA
jgi:hypothetical protein